MTAQIKMKLDIEGCLIDQEGWDDEAARKSANINHFKPEYENQKNEFKK